MRLVTVTPPSYALGPVTLAEVKAHLRVDGTDENALVSTYRLAAISHVANLCGRPLTGGTFRAEYDGWLSELRLPFAPVSAVTSVKYRDSAEVEHTVSTTVYLSDAAVDPARVVLAYGQSWPSATLSPSRPILITFTAGYGITSPATPACPDELKGAIFLLCEHWYQNRSAVIVGDNSSAISSEMEIGVKALLGPYILDHFGSIYAQ